MTEQQVRRPIKALVEKVCLDGHGRGSRLVAAFLRDAGLEVVYTCFRETSDIQLINKSDNPLAQKPCFSLKTC